MTCTEAVNMKMYEFAKKVIAPVTAAMFLAALFYPLCVENGICDYLKLWVFMGICIGQSCGFKGVNGDRGTHQETQTGASLVAGRVCGKRRQYRRKKSSFKIL